MGVYKELEDIIQRKELGNGELHLSWTMGNTDYGTSAEKLICQKHCGVGGGGGGG